MKQQPLFNIHKLKIGIASIAILAIIFGITRGQRQELSITETSVNKDGTAHSDQRAYIHGVDILDVNGNKLLIFSSNGYPTKAPADEDAEWEHDIYATWLNAECAEGIVAPSEAKVLVSSKYAQEPASAAINSKGQILITAEDAQYNLDTLDQTFGIWDAHLTPLKKYGTSLMQGSHSGHVAASGDKFLVTFSEGWIEGKGVNNLGTADDVYAKIIDADGHISKTILTSVSNSRNKRDWWPLAAGSNSNWLQIWQRLDGNKSTIYGTMTNHDGTRSPEFVIAQDNVHYTYDIQFITQLDLYLVTGTNSSGGYMTLIDTKGKIVLTKNDLPKTVRGAQSVVHEVDGHLRVVYPKASQGVAVVAVTPTAINLVDTIEGDHAWTYMWTDGTQVSDTEVVFATGTTAGIKLIRYDIGKNADEEASR